MLSMSNGSIKNKWYWKLKSLMPSNNNKLMTQTLNAESEAAITQAMVWSLDLFEGMMLSLWVI